MNIEERQRLLKDALTFINGIIKKIKKAWDQIKKFFMDNREIFERYLNVAKKRKKYKKRVRNRQLLYKKRKR
ncbi:hypothetical protein EXM76_02425 [Clostridium botulinum]|nr:hypothetical protein [Clostridium botulinum]